MMNGLMSGTDLCTNTRWGKIGSLLTFLVCVLLGTMAKSGTGEGNIKSVDEEAM